MTGNYTISKNIFYSAVLLVLVGCYTVTVSGLEPIYPEVVNSRSGAASFEVDSLRPTFRWESFPRSQDLRNDENGLLGRIHNLSYDLKIWRAQDGLPVQAIYSRGGIPAPMHKIEERLEPSTEYVWSVRARFEVDGGARVTEWAGIWRDRGDQRSPVVPRHPTYYRFKTPPLTIWVWN